MDTLVEVHGRPMKLSISKAAAKQLRQRTEPLLLEMELYFSCLVRKRVYVKESADDVEAISLAITRRSRICPSLNRNATFPTG